MEYSLAGKKVAILIANGFAELEMTQAQRALLKAGAAPKVIAPESGLVNGWMGKGWGHYFPADKLIGEALGADFDMLLLPGGERGVAKLSQNPHTRRIVGHFLDAGKPIAAMDEGIGLMAVPGKLRNRRITALPGAEDALRAAGGVMVDDDVVVDSATVTVRGFDNLQTFVDELLRMFGTFDQMRDAA